MNASRSEAALTTRVPVDRLIAVALPPCLALGLVAAVVLLEALGFQPWSRSPAVTVSEAAALGAAARAVELIANGHDPSTPAHIRAGILDSQLGMELRAIDAAILGRRPELVELLQRHGATTPDRERSICYARGIGLGEALPHLGAPAETLASSLGTAEVLRLCGS